MNQHRDEFSRVGADSVDRLEGKIWAPFTASEVTGAGTDDVVVTYLAAWNEPDTDRRMTLLASACDADVRYVDPEADVTGLEALSGVITSFQAAYPGHILRLASDVDAHHDVLRFAWLVERPDGAALSAGLDACSRAPDGRLVLIAGFFDAL